ncbi:hypothetical protein DICPUDRAFT_28679 [Dictyostelium purpureum]|uniref:Fatty acid hydroxylase domain-containing protein n=1 Tax=Dictyostelium purpureum TaxID=5786 RepID=F0ZCC4_DICPU|nr:uncharacterized protein DICPUDRAFT_28679 [Dictyostelium purpureum]EGC38396.1 hypothetical protein DICPUDRAFT_28679 [Dictyostelium purpureum]|eukprot:XP_003285057.1 hypothetical protein DICPUDRAFT_28679 [Dictyostelium purpureum]
MDSILNIYIEPYWLNLVNHIDNDDYLLFFGTIILHGVSLFIFNLPYLIIERIPYFNKYKIQKNKIKKYTTIIDIVNVLFYEHLMMDIPFMLVSVPTFKYFGYKSKAPLPTVSYLVGSLAMCMIIDDFLSYFIHRILHTPFVYKHVHKKHHTITSPNGLNSEYAHPIETSVFGMATFMGSILFYRDIFSFWVLITLKLYETVEAHSGYDLPWLPTKLIPFWGGATFHDYHHKNSIANFSTTFTFWDKVFGTFKN